MINVSCTNNAGLTSYGNIGPFGFDTTVPQINPAALSLDSVHTIGAVAYTQHSSVQFTIDVSSVLVGSSGLGALRLRVLAAESLTADLDVDVLSSTAATGSGDHRYVSFDVGDTPLPHAFYQASLYATSGAQLSGEREYVQGSM